MSVLYGAWDVTHNKSAGEITNCKYSAMPESENLANAHLIAAAPDLLEACEVARDALLLLGVDCDTGEIAKLRAAIAKAKGVES